MENRDYGYGRVSYTSQSEKRQIEAFKKIGIKERDIFIDKGISGKNFDREQYQIVKRLLREGDTLYVQSLDRFGRDYNMIVQQWKEITEEIKANIVVLDLPLLNTKNKKDLLGTFINDLILQILSYVAEQERIFIRKRQRDGIDVALKTGITKTGRPFGRPKIAKPENFDVVIDKWRHKEITAVAAMKELNLTKTTFYKMVKEDSKVKEKIKCK